MKTIYIPQLQVNVETSVKECVYHIITQENGTMLNTCAIESALMYGAVYTLNDTNVYILTVEEFAEYQRFIKTNSKAIAKQEREKYKLT